MSGTTGEWGGVLHFAALRARIIADAVRTAPEVASCKTIALDAALKLGGDALSAVESEVDVAGAPLSAEDPSFARACAVLARDAGVKVEVPASLCVALADAADDGDGNAAIPFQVGDTFVVTATDVSGWWRGNRTSLRDGSQVSGCFPYTYVRVVLGEAPPPQEEGGAGGEEQGAGDQGMGAAGQGHGGAAEERHAGGGQQQDEAPPTASKAALRCRVVHEYEAGADNELGLVVGEVIDVTKQHESGWWKGTDPRGKLGVFPSNFVEVIVDTAAIGADVVASVRVQPPAPTVGRCAESLRFSVSPVADARGSLASRIEPSNIEVVVVGPSNAPSTRGKVGIVPGRSGWFEVVLVPTEVGRNTVAARIAGQDIGGSPFVVNVAPENGPPAAPPRRPGRSTTITAAGRGPPPPQPSRPGERQQPPPPPPPTGSAAAPGSGSAGALAPPRPRRAGRSPPDGDTAVFGVFLSDAVQRSALDGDLVPAIVRRSVEYLDARGLRELGLYRLSGSLKDVRAYKAAWDEGDDVDYSGCNDPNVVAGLLKLFLRELPDRVAFLDEGGDDLDALAREVAELEPINKGVLAVLCRHFYGVQAHAEVNQMKISNIAICLCPTLKMKSNTFTALVMNHQRIFGDFAL